MKERWIGENRKGVPTTEMSVTQTFFRSYIQIHFIENANFMISSCRSSRTFKNPCARIQGFGFLKGVYYPVVKEGSMLSKETISPLQISSQRLHDFQVMHLIPFLSSRINEWQLRLLKKQTFDLSNFIIVVNSSNLVENALC